MGCFPHPESHTFNPPVGMPGNWTGSDGENPNRVSGLKDGYLNPALDDSRIDGVTGETGNVMNVQLRHEMLSVFVHRLEAHAQFRRNLFVRLAFGNQLEHFHLTRTQAVGAPLPVPCSVPPAPAAIMNALGGGGGGGMCFLCAPL